MGDLPTLELPRDKQATTQLTIQAFLSVVLSVGLIGFAMTSDNPTMRLVFWGVALANLLVLGMRFMTLVNSRVPVSITQDTVTIGSSAKVRVPRSLITGAGHHPKTGEPCLYFSDPEKEQSGPLRLPTRFIRMDATELFGLLVKTVGRAPEANPDQDA